MHKFKVTNQNEDDIMKKNNCLINIFLVYNILFGIILGTNRSLAQIERFLPSQGGKIEVQLKNNDYIS